MSAPNGVGPGTLGYFSCKSALSESGAMGAARPIMDPKQLGLAAPSRERGVVGRPPCPVVAVLLAAVEADELFCAPKGIGPSAVVDFSCKSASSEGAEEGAIGAIMDPRRCGQSRPCAS
jgi:hypothetical protein